MASSAQFIVMVASSGMSILSFILLAILGIYMLMIIRFRICWNRYPVFEPEERNATVPLSLVIAFRNELPMLGTLLECLDKQLLTTEMFEVILVNDGSDDGSERIGREFACNRNNVLFIENPGDVTGKKSALAKGIEAAGNEVIVITDADCIMESRWLLNISCFFSMYSPDMMMGLVNINQGKTMLTRFQEMEFLSLIASGAGAAACNRPLYCNAACLAFKKSFYAGCTDPLQGYTASGDDTFFLHAAKKARKSIMLLKSVDGTVTTRGLHNWQGFINQRLRWISKSRYYTDKDTMSVAIVVMLMNVAWLCSLLLLFADGNLWVFAVLFAGKATADCLLMRNFYRFLGRTFRLDHFLLFSMIYPFYAIFVTLGGLFFGYSWKGRHYRPGGV